MVCSFQFRFQRISACVFVFVPLTFIRLYLLTVYKNLHCVKHYIHYAYTEYSLILWLPSYHALLLHVLSVLFVLQRQQHADNIITVRLARIIYLFSDVDRRLLSSTLKRRKYKGALNYNVWTIQEYIISSAYLAIYYNACIILKYFILRLLYTVYYDVHYGVLSSFFKCLRILMLCIAVACTFWTTIRPPQRFCVQYLAYCPVDCK